MVHLATVVSDVVARRSTLPQLENFTLPDLGDDEFTASVYGSKFADQGIPKHEMPDGEMPREVAYRLIKDDLTLDGVPTLKSVCFVHF